MADLSSKVTIQRLPASLVSIIGVPTTSIHLTGTALKGPVGEVGGPHGSWPTWKRIYGGLITASYLPIAVWCIMRAPQGAKRLFTTRVTHYADPDDPATTTAVKGTVNLDVTTAVGTQGSVTGSVAGPWNMTSGDTLIVHADEDVGGPDTATFTGTPGRLVGGAFGVVPAGGTVTMLCDADPDPQLFTFVGGETVAQAAALVNDTANGFKAIVVGGVTLDFEADTAGTDSSIAITADTLGTAAALGHTSPSSAGGGGNVGNIDAVLFSEAKTIIEAAVTHPATGVTVSDVAGRAKITSDKVGGGVGSSVQIEAASTLDTVMGFDNLLHQGTASTTGPVIGVDGRYAGAYANDLTLDVENATDGEAAHFKLKVYYDGEIIETWDNLSMVSTDAQFHETVINNEDTGSEWIETRDLVVGTRPDVVTAKALTGGNDGLVGLVDADYIGDAGIWATRFLPDYIALRGVPGAATATIQTSLVSMCELTNSFAVLAGPLGQTVSGIRTYFKTTAALKELSEYAAFYWPNPKIANPDTDVYGSGLDLVVPADGPVLASYIVNDARAGGVYEAPAGLENGKLFGVVGVENEQVFDEAVRDQLYPDRINPIWHMAEGEPYFIDGSRTLKSTGPFPSVGESRGVVYITQSVRVFAERVRHKNITLRLLDDVGKSVKGFLIRETRQGAFFTDDPDKAFFLDTSEKVNPPLERAAHRLHIFLGLNMAEPAEYIFIEVTKDQRALFEELGL